MRLVVWYPLLVAMPAVLVYTAFTGWPPGHYAWLMPLTLGLAAAGLWRIALVGVLLHGDQIKVRTMLRTRTLRWDEVAEVADGTDVGGELELAFVLKSGERVSTLVTAITHGGHEVYLTRRQFTRLVTRLRERSTAASPAT